MGVLSCLPLCCKIMTHIRWKIVRDICLDIYRLIIEGYDEPDSSFEFLNALDEGENDPIKIFQQADTEDNIFRFVIFVVWLHRNHPEFAYHYYREITLKYPERCLSLFKLVEILVSLRHTEQKESQSQS